MGFDACSWKNGDFSVSLAYGVVADRGDMKNILKKLHIMSNRSEDVAGSTSSKGHKSNDGSFPKKPSNSSSPQSSEHKSFPGISSWLNSVANKQNPSPPSSNLTRGERVEPSDLVSSGGLDMVSDSVRRDSGSSASRDPEVEEEYQIQLALEMSAKEDPEAVQIEAVKQISLGSCGPDNTPAEVVAYRYWVSFLIHFKHVDLRLKSHSPCHADFV